MNQSAYSTSIEAIDITQILTHQNGEAVFPLPRIKNLAVHSKLNLAALLFEDMTDGDNLRSKTAYTREGRKQLFAVLQSARGSSVAVLKEKFLALGSSGILAEHQLQTQLEEHHLKGQSQLTVSDIARKALLHSHFMEGHASSSPISQLPLITVSDANHQLRDVPVCKPFHLKLNFFNKENHVLHYPVRAFYLDSFNLMAYNLSSGAENIYKKLYSTIPTSIECIPINMLYSSKQHLFIVVFELSGPTGSVHEVVLKTEVQSFYCKGTSLRGRDAAFIGPNENQYAILDEERTSLSLHKFQGLTLLEQNRNIESLEENKVASNQSSAQFQFETEVDRIFSVPLDGTILYAISGKHIALVELLQEHRLLTDNGYLISTKTNDKKLIKLRRNESVYQWFPMPHTSTSKHQPGQTSTSKSGKTKLKSCKKKAKIKKPKEKKTSTQRAIDSLGEYYQTTRWPIKLGDFMTKLKIDEKEEEAKDELLPTEICPVISTTSKISEREKYAEEPTPKYCLVVSSMDYRSEEDLYFLKEDDTYPNIASQMEQVKLEDYSESTEESPDVTMADSEENTASNKFESDEVAQVHLRSGKLFPPPLKKGVSNKDKGKEI
ncbi:hypothetical protein M5K25_001743 [Dendrobium thyrsiflorum]|uniref:Uncharacterized protein n=1 Tax=Dendrobium thyrsiflorum TaxID=117978 RepID=A0ABD0W0X6_DENTH